MWLVWTGGNDRFWDYMVEPTFGTFDLLKIVAPDPGSLNARPHRWRQLGIVNEPCFQAPTRRDPNRFFGLWLDERKPGCAARSVRGRAALSRGSSRARAAPASRTAGRCRSARFTAIRPGSSACGSSPIPSSTRRRRSIGATARDIIPIPAFYNDKKLVRPYRVGMSCAFCHVGPSPLQPAGRPERARMDQPQLVGRRPISVDGPGLLLELGEGAEQLPLPVAEDLQAGDDGYLAGLHRQHQQSADHERPLQRAGAARDGARISARRRWPAEQLDNVQFNDVTKDASLTRFYNKPQVFTPRVLKDGSDSVGMLGALNRVYLNIGLYSEEWMRHFNPVIGGKTVTPIRIADARSASPYWRATEKGTPAMALFFLKAAKPDRLAAIPGGAAYLTAPPAQLARGKEVFADTCARCHSSKGPQAAAEREPRQERRPGLSRPLQGLVALDPDPGFKQAMRAEVAKPDFLANNYLSTDARIPVTLLRTNLCSPLATNAIRGNIWDNFSSESYKNLPAVGWASYNDPYNGERRQYRLPGGGRGYTRPPTPDLALVDRALSCSTTGSARSTPIRRSPAGWPRSTPPSARCSGRETARAWTRCSATASAGSIDRTDASSNLFIPASFLPTPGRSATRCSSASSARSDSTGRAISTIGPIPKGMPIGALTNLRLARPRRKGRTRASRWSACSTSAVHARQGAARSSGQRPPADDRETLLRFAPLREDLRNAQQVPRLRRQPRPLFRHRAVREPRRPDRGRAMVDRQRGAAQRSRQGSPDRLPQDLLMGDGFDCDYIVVGSGAGGGTVAARLAEAGMDVILLEAGGDPVAEGAERFPCDYRHPRLPPDGVGKSGHGLGLLGRALCRPGARPSGTGNAARTGGSSIRAPERSAAAPPTMR